MVACFGILNCDTVQFWVNVLQAWFFKFLVKWLGLLLLRLLLMVATWSDHFHLLLYYPGVILVKNYGVYCTVFWWHVFSTIHLRRECSITFDRVNESSLLWVLQRDNIRTENMGLVNPASHVPSIHGLVFNTYCNYPGKLVILLLTNFIAEL